MKSEFEKYMQDVERLAGNSVKAFNDEKLSGFHKLSIYRSTLFFLAKASQKNLDAFNASLTLEERLKFDSAEKAFSEKSLN